MTCLVIIAKAPVPGLAKTRLCPPCGPAEAAGIAAAALLDTLDAARAVPGVRPVVVMTGDLDLAARPAELRSALRGLPMFPQRGGDFADRLANAHADVAAAYPGRSILQIGMDTPQAGPELLGGSVDLLHRNGNDAVLGRAADGGWWALGLHDPAHAEVLRTIPTSRADTGDRTENALRHRGLRLGTLPVLSDVDTMADALAVADAAPHTRFAHAVATVIGRMVPVQ